MFRRALVVALVAASAAVAAGSTSAAPRMLVGLYDEAQVYGNGTRSFPTLRLLRTQVLRVTLWWGGPLGVAQRRPVDGADPEDRAYNWSLYDETVREAARHRIRIVFSIYGTPRWANGGRGLNRVPARPAQLLKFATAAATRYSGSFLDEKDGRVLPAVRMWTAWNEPNNPVFLRPQYRRARGRWIVQSAVDYAKICNAISAGVHSTLLRGQKVACGVTGPRGNNAPRSSRPSVAPITFLRAMKKAGARRFDVYAHHPYYGRASETPTTKPRDPSAVTLANIDRLIRELTRLYGRKRVWITEYGYQTNPPDRLFGVSLAKQSRYLRQAYAIARRHPRIDMMLWFLLRDELRRRGRDGWQSGLLTASGRRKPAFFTFRRLPR